VNELRAGRKCTRGRKKHQVSAGKASELKAEGIERGNKANFFLFFRSFRELFL